MGEESVNPVEVINHWEYLLGLLPLLQKSTLTCTMMPRQAAGRSVEAGRSDSDADCQEHMIYLEPKVNFN